MKSFSRLALLVAPLAALAAAAACHNTSVTNDAGTPADAPAMNGVPDASAMLAALREPDASGLDLSSLSAGGLLGHGMDRGPAPLVIPSGTASAMPAGASPPDREKELVGLLSGNVGPDALPVVPTDPGASFDEGLRSRLKNPTRFEASVSFTPAEAKGALPAEALARILAGARPRARMCYRNALSANPEVHGELHVRFEIGSNGEVKSANEVPPAPSAKAAAGNLATAPALSSCVLGVVKRLMFPSVDAGTTTATFTARFEAHADTAR